ncbi:hypothetical protein BMR07_17380, partial [Methylococcaceae bacterium CS1]
MSGIKTGYSRFYTNICFLRQNLDQVINDLVELGDCFGKARSGYSDTSSIGKGIGGGNKIENIPAGLESYTEFLQSDQNTNWIK